MEVQIFAKGVELTDSLKDLIDKKLVQTLDKFFKKNPTPPSASISITRGERFGFQVKMEINTHNGKTIYAEKKEKELSAAITGLKEELKRVISEQK